MPIVDVTEAAQGLVSTGLLAALPRARAPSLRIGIVCMTKRPTAFATWLEYHHEICGIERFFLRVEDTPELAHLLRASPWDSCVDVEYASGSRDYFAQMDRQNHFVDSVLPRARAAGLDFVLHIDDDELLYCAGGLSALHDALSRADSSIGNLHVHNMEAVLPRLDCVNPFVEARLPTLAPLEVTSFRHDTAHFCAYANGKSFGRLNNLGLRASGPHNFSCFPVRTHDLSPAAAVILHYESANVTAWRAKYTDLARRHAGSNAVQLKAPSLFYHESMEAVGRAVFAEMAGNAQALERANAAAMEVYARWKLSPVPLPSPPADGRPRHLNKEAITIINIFGQRRDPLALPRPQGITAGDAHALQLHASRRQAELPPATAALEAATAPQLLKSVSSAQVHGALDDPPKETETGHGSEDAALRELEALLKRCGIREWATHASALHTSGTSVALLRRCSEPTELDQLGKAAGLSLGARLRLKGSLQDQLAAPPP